MTARRFLICATLLAASLGCLTSRHHVHAQTGVAIDIQSIQIDEELVQGGRYNVPPIVVRNPGDAAGRYVMGVSFFGDQRERRPDESWIRFSSDEFELAPGESRRVEIELRLPGETDAGEYLALIEARAVPAGGNTRLGAATGVKLNFTVKPSSNLDSFVLGVQHFAGDGAPWSYVVPSSLFLLALIWLASRRFRLRMELTRK